MPNEAVAGSAIPTITDVAAAAGVSIRTVSRVLNDATNVNAETRKAVQSVIASLGFVPSSRARAFASGRSGLIGVVQSDANVHTLSVFQRGIVEVCTAAGYELIVHTLDVHDDESVRKMATFITRSRVDGLIVLPPASESPLIADALRHAGVPAVAFAARAVPGYRSFFVFDEHRAAGEVASHFAALGHRRVAVISGPMWRLSAQERVNGFRDALCGHGIVLEPEDVVAGDYTFASGIAAAHRLLDRATPPTAIFASNDIMAAAVLKVAFQRNLRVPDQLSVAGFDDVDLASILSPALTTVQRPLSDIARRATENLVRMISGRNGPVDPGGTVEFRLVTRESTGPAPGR